MAGDVSRENGKLGGRPAGSHTGVGLLRQTNSVEMQRALKYMLNFIMTGELPEVEGMTQWRKLVMLKMKIAEGDMVKVTRANGQVTDVYNALPDRQSLDWLMQWIVGKQPEIIKLQGDVDNPLILGQLTDEQLKDRIATIVGQRVEDASAGGRAPEDGKGGDGVPHVLDGGSAVSAEPVPAVQTAGGDAQEGGAVPSPVKGETGGEPEAKDNRDTPVASGTPEIDFGDDKLDHPADSTESELAGLFDERETGQRQEVSGGDQGAVREE